MTSNQRKQYYYYLLLAALFNCRQAFASNHIFVNNIVPLISNLSASAISFDNSNHNSSKVPSSPITTSAGAVPVFSYVPITPTIQQHQGHDRDYNIHELTKRLETKLKRIRNQELDVPVVQVSSLEYK